MSYITELKEKYINIDEGIAEDINTQFQIEEFISLGGSSIVVKAKTLEEDEKLNFYPGMEVVLKLCDPFITYAGCKLYKNEARYSNIFSYLNCNKICYNYPVIYGFFHRCLFFRKEDVETIIEYISDNKDLIGDSLDAFIIYCCTPKHIKIDKDIIDYVVGMFESNQSFILKSRDILPKSNNIKGLVAISRYMMLKDNSWENINMIYDYLEGQLDIGCDIFLVMQHLDGRDLVEIKKRSLDYKFSDSIFFEHMYSTLCSILLLKKLQVDANLSNAMIVNSDTYRIYEYEDKYYIINGPMFYWIDFTDLTDFTDVILTYSEYRKFFNFFTVYTDEQLSFIKQTFSSERDTDFPAQYIIGNLFKWISNRIIVLDEDTIKSFMIKNPKYVLANANVFIQK